ARPGEPPPPAGARRGPRGHRPGRLRRGPGPRRRGGRTLGERHLRAPLGARVPPDAGRPAAGLRARPATQRLPLRRGLPRPAGDLGGRAGRRAAIGTGGADDLRQLDRRRYRLRLLAPRRPRLRPRPGAAGGRHGGVLPLRPLALARRRPAGRGPSPVLVGGRRSARAVLLRAHLPLRRPASQPRARRQRPVRRRRPDVQPALGRPGRRGPGGLPLPVVPAGGADGLLGRRDPAGGRRGAGRARPRRRPAGRGQLDRPDVRRRRPRAGL
ncbi:MAG: hypothetical protein AVDCRST_MAG48-2223, partial [uncultured Friedmanniella sp.]